MMQDSRCSNVNQTGSDRATAMFPLPGEQRDCSKLLLGIWYFLIGLSGLHCNLSLAYVTHIQLHAPGPPAAVAGLRQLISNSYAGYSDSFSISAHGIDRCARSRISDFVDEFLVDFNELKVTIDTWGGSGRQLQVYRMFNVIIIDGLESLQMLDPAALTQNYDISEHYLVYLLPPCGTSTSKSPPPNYNNIKNTVLAYFWRHYIINVSLLLDKTDGRCALYTFFPFSDNGKCKSVTVRRINQFAKGHWMHSGWEAIFPRKIINMRGCPLRVAVWDTPPYFSLRPGNARDAWQVGDFEGTLLLELAKKLNFSIELVIPPNDEQRGKRFPNGTTTGAMNLLVQRLADFSLGSFRYTLERSQILTAALPYYQTFQIYAVLLAGDPYTSLEILAFAFDNQTWLCLGLSLQVVALLGLFLDRFKNRSRFAHIMLGHPTPQTPITNAFAGFFGNALTQVPWNTFTRYVFLLWVVYGFLLRSAYQSLLLKLLQTDQHRKLPKTLDDLIAAGYTLVMTNSTKDSVSIAPKIQAGLIDVIVIANTSEQATFAELDAARPELPRLLAGVSPLDFLTCYVIEQNRRGIFHVLPENIFTQFITMYFTKHSYLIARFNELFMFLRGHGLIEYWAKQSLDTSYMSDKQTASAKSVTMSQISGVFIVCLTLLGVAFAVFCAEIVTWQCNNKITNRRRRRIPRRR